MGYMNNALLGAGIPADAGVAIEYRIPQTAKRVDFILTGLDAAGRHAAIIGGREARSDYEKIVKLIDFK